MASRERHCVSNHHRLNTLRPRQNGRHFPDDIFKFIFLNENVWILTKISLKSVPNGPIDNIPAFVQIMAWRRPGDKPLSEPMMVRLPTHICVTRPQWVNCLFIILFKLTAKETLNLRIASPMWVKPPLTGGFPSHMASDAEKFHVPTSLQS